MSNIKDIQTPPPAVQGAWADVSVPDIELNGEKLHRTPHDAVPIAGALTDASMDRSINQASTVSLTLHDPERRLVESGILSSRARIKIDAYKFALAAVATSGDTTTLTFEDDAVALLSLHATPRKANRKKMTRAQFAKLLVDEVPQLSFFCPELLIREPIGSLKATPSQIRSDTAKEYGFASPIPANLTVKNQKMSKEQARNIDIALKVGKSLGADPFTLWTGIAVAITESRAINLSGGGGGSVGMYQLIASWGTDAQRMDPAFSANWFFTRAVKVRKEHPEYTERTLAQAVQRSGAGANNNGGNYAPWVGEGKFIYAAWSGDGSVTKSGLAKKKAYEFHRGGAGHRNENSWACLQRLAQEVNWLCFVIGYTVYFISQPSLYTSRPIATINRETEGVIELDFSYDVGKLVSEATLTVHTKRWQVDPGAVVMLEKCGPANGRWLVEEITRSLYDDVATITLMKPTAALPEPAAQQVNSTTGKAKKRITGALGQGGPLMYPLAVVGKLIGFPYQGTHTLYGNWQSDNAVDISVPVGTAVYACFNGTIGDGIGSLGSSDSNLQGLRVTVNGVQNSAFYQHLSRLSVAAGDKVKQGDLLGFSGSANGVAHLHFALEFGVVDKLIEGLTKGVGK